MGLACVCSRILTSATWLVTACAIVAFLLRKDVAQHSPACEMTFMHPKYLSVNDQPSHPRYQLFKYTEDDQNLNSASTKQERRLVNALFIPGNAASYKQVRSIASETARQAARAEFAELPQLQWYAVDTGEDLSAFDAWILEDQVKYTVECLAYIASRVKPDRRGRRFATVMGHSMGGLVARAALGRLATNPEHADVHFVLVTLATPHQHPPLLLQPSMLKWHQGLAAEPHPPNLDLLISVDGGRADVQVAPTLTQISGDLAVHSSSASVPGVWVEAGHQAVLWCNQLNGLVASFLLRTPSLLTRGELHAEAVKTFRSSLITATAALSTPPESHSGSCTGVNLAWYLQYIEPRTVKKQLLTLKANVPKGAHKVGSMWSWQLGQDPLEFSIMASAALPCEHFRVWVVRSGPEGEELAEEVSLLAAEAPPLFKEALPITRNRSMAFQVMKGRNYHKHSGWLLSLPSTFLAGASQLLLWVHSEERPPGFLVQVQKASTQASRDQGIMASGWWGLHRAASGPMVSRVLQQHHQPLLHWMLYLGVKMQVVEDSHDAVPAKSCWSPLLLSAPLPSHTLAATPATSETIRVGRDPLPVSSYLSISQPPAVYLAADPRCGYTIRPTLDMPDVVLDALLQNVGSIPGMVASILLLSAALRTATASSSSPTTPTTVITALLVALSCTYFRHSPPSAASPQAAPPPLGDLPHGLQDLPEKLQNILPSLLPSTSLQSKQQHTSPPVLLALLLVAVAAAIATALCLLATFFSHVASRLPRLSRIMQATPPTSSPNAHTPHSHTTQPHKPQSTSQHGQPHQLGREQTSNPDGEAGVIPSLAACVAKAAVLTGFSQLHPGLSSGLAVMLSSYKLGRSRGWGRQCQGGRKQGTEPLAGAGEEGRDCRKLRAGSKLHDGESGKVMEGSRKGADEAKAGSMKREGGLRTDVNEGVREDEGRTVGSTILPGGESQGETETGSGGRRVGGAGGGVGQMAGEENGGAVAGDGGVELQLQLLQFLMSIPALVAWMKLPTGFRHSPALEDTLSSLPIVLLAALPEASAGSASPLPMLSCSLALVSAAASIMDTGVVAIYVMAAWSTAQLGTAGLQILLSGV